MPKYDGLGGDDTPGDTPAYSTPSFSPAGDDHFGVPANAEDGQKAKKSKLKLPKSMRQVAGRAAKETKKAVKGASKAAVAVSQKLGVQEGSHAKYQAASNVDAETIGASVFLEDPGEEEEFFEDGAEHDAGEGLSSESEDCSDHFFEEQRRAKEQPRSAEQPNSAQPGGGGAAPRGAPGSSSSFGGAPTAKAKVKAKAKAVAKAVPEPCWDPSSFTGKPRPLQCGSIWDIPTSRFPEPEKRPLPEAKPAPTPEPAPAPAPAPQGAATPEGGSRWLCRCHIL